MKITKTETKISVQSPYNPDLLTPAKRLGGKWTGTCWEFDIRDEARVKALYLKIYGEWDEDIQKVDIQVVLIDDICKWHSGIFCAGRQVAYATGRDSGATLGDGVVVTEGDGFTSGGSVKNWTTRGIEDTVFELRDVPLSMAQKEVDNPSNDWTVNILVPRQTTGVLWKLFEFKRESHLLKSHTVSLFR